MPTIIYAPFRCNSCGHTWDKKNRARRQCPNCKSKDVDEAVNPVEDVAYPVQSYPQPAPATPDPYEPPTADEFLEEELVEKKKPTKKPAAPKGMSSPYFKNESKFIDEEGLSAQEIDFANLLEDASVRQPQLITRIIFQGNPEDPKYVDDILKQFNVGITNRRLVLGVWFTGSEEALALSKQEGGEGSSGHGTGDLKNMTNEMMDMYRFKMMNDMLNPDAKKTATVPPPPAESLVPILGDDGMPIMDELNRPVKVPASIYMMMQARKHQEAPSSLEQFMGFMQVFMQMQNPQQAEAIQSQGQVIALQSQVEMQKMDSARGTEISELKSALQTEKMLKNQSSKYGQLLDEQDKQVQELRHELEKMRDDRQRSYEDTQITMQEKLNELAIDTGKGFTKEFREFRRDVKDFGKEQMKSQQLLEVGRAQAQGQNPVVEMTAEQLEAEMAAMDPQGQFDDGALDGRITAPEDYEGEEDDGAY